MATNRNTDAACAREGYFPVRDGRLYLREVGDGPPLVVLHGGPDFNHSYLLPELDRLSGACRVIYYDQRGRGRSSRDVAPEDVGIASDVEDLDDLRRHLGVETLALLGHSWGGLLAMEYASRHPERVARLVLLNTAPASHADLLRFRGEREAADPDRVAKMRAIADTAAWASGDVEAEADYYRLHFGATLPLERLEAVVRRLRADFTPDDILKARAIERRLYAQTWLAPGYNLLPALRERRMPTLVIHGDRDLIPLECARNIADAVPGASLLVLEDCGHFGYLERPDEVCHAIVDFLSRTEASWTS